MTLALVYGRAQELQGRFYAEKDSYILGEPVIFNVEITNAGKEIAYVKSLVSRNGKDESRNQ